MHVHPVGDQRRTHGRLGEGERGHAGLAVVHAAHPVEEVGGEACARGHRRVELPLERRIRRPLNARGDLRVVRVQVLHQLVGESYIHRAIGQRNVDALGQ